MWAVIAGIPFENEVPPPAKVVISCEKTTAGNNKTQT
jgi:hypothetical protein